MTDISLNTTGTWQAENRSWLGSAFGTTATETITLNLALFDADRYPDGYIPSGTVLSKMDAQVNGIDVYGPYDPASNVPAGSGTASGHLFSSVHVVSASAKVGAALFTVGKVRSAKLPHATGKGSIDAAAKAEMTHIRYI